MLDLPFFLLPKSWQDSIRKQEKEAREAEARYFEEVLVPNAIDWDPDFAKKDLNDLKKVCFKASTYIAAQKPLFPDVKPVILSQKNLREIHPNDIQGPVMTNGSREVKWVYRNAVLTRGDDLWLAFGNAKGKCYFDDDIAIPQLCHYRKGHWERPFLVWMSHTPMEMFTQRGGIRHCSGRVCIGGYGMGWFLEQVAAKKNVKEIVVVERSKELLDWFARAHCKKVQKETGKKIRIVCEDVFPYLEKHHTEFDKIALDVFSSYGNNNAEDDPRIKDLLRITLDPRRPWLWDYRFSPKKLWCWGSVKVGRQERIRYI